MLPFLIRLHLSMFFVLVTSGTICTFWGLGLLIFRRAPGKAGATAPAEASQPVRTAIAAEQGGAGEQTPSLNVDNTLDREAPAAQDRATGEQKTTLSAQAGAPGRPARPQPAISPLFLSALKLTGMFALIQAALGGLLVLLGASPKDPLHYVYGIVVLLAVPVGFVYMSGKAERARRDLWILVIAALIVAAAAVRAFMTGFP